MSSDSDNDLEISDSEDEKEKNAAAKQDLVKKDDVLKNESDSDNEESEGGDSDDEEAPQLIDHSKSIATTKVRLFIPLNCTHLITEKITLD